MMLLLLLFLLITVYTFFLIGSTGGMKTMSSDAPAGDPKTASSKVMSPDGGEQHLNSAAPSSSQNWCSIFSFSSTIVSSIFQFTNTLVLP